MPIHAVLLPFDAMVADLPSDSNFRKKPRHSVFE